MNELVVERVEQNSTPTDTFLNSLSDPAVLLRRESQTLDFVNHAAHNLLGLGPLDSDDRTWSECLAPSSRKAWHEFDALLENHCTGQSRAPLPTLQLKFEPPSGKAVLASLRAIQCFSEQWLLLFHASESTRPESTATLESVAEALPMRVVFKDLEGKRTFANQVYLQHREMTLEELLGKTDADLFPPDIAATFEKDDATILQEGRLLATCEENVDANGNRQWIETVKGPLRDSRGNIVGIQILSRDATQQHFAEAAFEKERDLLHALLDNVPDSIYFKDKDSRFVRVSQSLAAKFKLAGSKNIIGLSDADIFTEEHAKQALADERAVMESGQAMVSQIEKETWPDRPDTWCSTTKMPLRNKRNEIVGTFGITRDVTELVNAQRELQEARDAADRANAAKSQFLANMSHEIRTPMNGVLGMAELLSHTKLEDDQRSYLEMIDRSAKSLLRIINDILDFSKVEAGQLQLEFRPFDLRRCLTHAAKGHASRAAVKSVELKLELSPQLPRRVIGDPDRLNQVVINLLGNAIKFTSHGYVELKAVVDESITPAEESQVWVRISVTDTGLGIEPSKLESIFNAFAQADVSTTRRFGGTGLGLSISKTLVEMMGGELTVESQPDRGSVFHFSLPFDLSQPSDPSNSEAPSKAESDLRRSLHDKTFIVLSPKEDLALSLSNYAQAVNVKATFRSQALTSSIPDDLATKIGEVDGLVLDETIFNGRLTQQELLEQLSRFRNESDIPACVVILSTMVNPLRFEKLREVCTSTILQTPALPTEILHALKRILKRAQLDLANDAYAASADFENSPTGNGVTPVASRRLQLLLAEDGAVNQAVLLGLLERLGHSVTCVGDGAAAVDAWLSGEFDAILMDLQMPVMDGLAAAREIRDIENAQGLAPTRIIAVTAAAMESDREQCKEVGMNDYLSKPIDFPAFERTIASIQPRQRKAGQAAKRMSPSTSIGGAASNAGEEAKLKFRSVAGGAAPTSPTSEFASGFNPSLDKYSYTQEQRVQLVKAFLMESTQRARELDVAQETQDLALLVRASHSLKSAARVFDADAVADASAEVEQHARDDQFEPACKILPKLHSALSILRDDMKRWLLKHD